MRSELRAEPDVKKLARAVVALALELAQAEADAQAQSQLRHDAKEVDQ